MAIALAEADKYEILDKIGELDHDSSIEYYFCSSLTSFSIRLRFLWDHSQSQAEDRRIRECSALVSCCNLG
jgi:hypothetical protein